MKSLKEMSDSSQGALMGKFGGSFGTENNIQWLNNQKIDAIIEFVDDIVDPVLNSDYTHPDEYYDIFNRLKKYRDELNKLKKQ